MNTGQPVSRTRAFALAFGTSQLQQVSTTLISLVATPFLLQWLGAERFGTWRVIESLLAYLVIIPTCFSVAASFRFVQYLTDRDFDSANRLISSVFVVSLILALCTILTGAALLPLLHILVSAPEALSSEVRIAYLLALTTALFFPLSIPRFMLEAAQQSYRVNITLIIASAAMTIASLALAFHGFGVPGQAIAALINSAVQVAILTLVARRIFPWVRRQGFDRNIARSVLIASTQMLLGGLLGTIAVRSEFLAINAFDGAAATARYDISKRAFAVVNALLLAVTLAAWVPLGQLYRQGHRERFEFGLGSCYRLVWGLGFATVIPLTAYLGQFVALWIKTPGIFAGDTAAVGFGVCTMLFAIYGLQIRLLTSLRSPRDGLPASAVYAAVSVAGTVCGALLAGAAGVAWGFSLALFITVAVNAWILKRKLEVGSMSMLRAGVPALMIAVPYSLALWWWSHSHAVAGWFGLAGEMALSGALYLLVWYVLAVPAEVRAIWLHRLRPHRAPQPPEAQ